MLQVLDERRSLKLPHDDRLRAYLEPYLSWHSELLHRLETDGEAYSIPPVPAALMDPNT